MSDVPRIALIHATRVAIDPIEKAAALLWPEAEMVTILEEGLSIDRQKSDALSDALFGRIVSLSRYAEGLGADGVLFTCSAFGAAIEEAASASPVPVMKPNEAMFDAAFAHGARIAMIYTFPPAAPGMEQEFREAAKARGSDAVLTSYFAEGALQAKQVGDDAKHNRLIAEVAARIVEVDVIMLAQFSMAGAAEEVRLAVAVPVLSSPEAAILEMRRRLGRTGAAPQC